MPGESDYREPMKCWCGADGHETKPGADLATAWVDLWHQVVGGLRLPEFVGWLNRKLSGSA